MRFTQRLHQPVRPAEDGDGMDEIENFKIIQADFPQVIKLVDPHIIWMCGQIHTEIEQRLLEIWKVRIKPVLVYLAHNLGPHLQPGLPIIISSHSSFGALYLSKRLSERQLRLPIIAWGTTLPTARRQTDGRSVVVNTVRQKVDFATLPKSAAPEGRSPCTELFGDQCSGIRYGWRSSRGNAGTAYSVPRVRVTRSRACVCSTVSTKAGSTSKPTAETVSGARRRLRR